MSISDGRAILQQIETELAIEENLNPLLSPIRVISAIRDLLKENHGWHRFMTIAPTGR